MISEEAAAETATILDAPSELWAVRIATVIQDYKNLGAALQHDLTEARRVARVLGFIVLQSYTAMNDEQRACMDTALAYPEQDSTKET